MRSKSECFPVAHRDPPMFTFGTRWCKPWRWGTRSSLGVWLVVYYTDFCKIGRQYASPGQQSTTTKFWVAMRCYSCSLRLPVCCHRLIAFISTLPPFHKATVDAPPPCTPEARAKTSNLLTESLDLSTERDIKKRDEHTIGGLWFMGPAATHVCSVTPAVFGGARWQSGQNLLTICSASNTEIYHHAIRWWFLPPTSSSLTIFAGNFTSSLLTQGTLPCNQGYTELNALS